MHKYPLNILLGLCFIVSLNSCNLFTNKNVERVEDVIQKEQQLIGLENDDHSEKYLSLLEKNTAAFFDSLPKEPGVMDWLKHHNERGQSFATFHKSHKEKMPDSLKYIYIQTLGGFTQKQKELLEEVISYTSIFFQREVKVLDSIPSSVIPEEFQRINENSKNLQYATSYILHNILLKNKPKDALAYLIFTPTDLYPSGRWNYVFGQAIANRGVGVWSIYRFGDVHKGEEIYSRCRMRTIKTAIHEIGHIFGFMHCIAYDCCMSGSNYIGELDRHPVLYCPQCSAKVNWYLDIDLEKKYSQILAFWKKRDTDTYQKYKNIYQNLRKKYQP